jgi:hypothetical protein
MSARAGAPTTEEFALAQFEDLSDADKLSLPSFERLSSGVEAGGDAIDLGRSARTRAVMTSLAYDTTILDSPSAQPASYSPTSAAQLAMNKRAAAARATNGFAGRYAPPAGAVSRVGLAPERYVVASTSDLTRGAVSSDGSKRGALLALAAYVASHAAARGQLQVVRASEAA